MSLAVLPNAEQSCMLGCLLSECDWHAKCREVVDVAYGKIKELRAEHREKLNEWRAQEDLWQSQRREDYQRR